MLPDELLILGTNPKKIFCGRERARDLLCGDWKYWRKVDIWHFTIPIKINGILRKKYDKWLISKLQLINDFNTNYIIFAWGVFIALIVSMLLLSITCFMNV